MNKEDIYRDLSSLEERYKRLFEEIVSAHNKHNTWSPLIDVYETDESFTVEAEIPGVEKDSLEIRIEDNVLILQGHRKTGKTGRERYHMIERPRGSFSRSFILSEGIDKENITASLKDGILTITIPKRRLSEERKIRIEEV